MTQVRLADLLAALSGAGDLGMGHTPGSAVRACLLATGIARHLGMIEQDVHIVYHTSLLQHAGCTAYAHETARSFGDDVAVRRAGSLVDFGNPAEAMRFMLRDLGRGRAPIARARVVLAAMRLGSTFDMELSRANCEVATHLAGQLEVGEEVARALGDIYEWWDGKGNPRHIAGEDIVPAARIVQVASQAMLFADLGGPDLATTIVRDRSGGMLDPVIAAAFLEHGAGMLAEIDAADPAESVLAAEPEPGWRIPEDHLDIVARSFAIMADLKSPYLHGHSTGVAELAAGAAARLGIAAPEQRNLRLAGLLHDLGRIGVSSEIWDKRGPLSAVEWDQVRLHPYHTERILSHSTTLAPLARMAGMHHERLDGTGYYRESPASEQSLGVRVLAAADAFQAMTQDRPHRPARSPTEAASVLGAGIAQGRYDAAAARAVLAAAGKGTSRRESAWPASLTDREVEVLQLAARGASTKEIGTALSISPKTADHHVQHIYAKIGVSTRAGAAIFAMEHLLIRPAQSSDIG